MDHIKIVFLLLIVVICMYNVPEFFYDCRPIYKCNINRHLRRKCTWISPCYNNDNN